MPDDRATQLPPRLKTLVRRQMIFALMLFALFVGVILNSGAKWSWSLVGIVAAVGFSLFLFAAIAWFSAKFVATAGRGER